MRSFHDDALFLVGFGQQQVGIDLAVDVAHQAIQLIHRLLGRAAVARHGHPAGVNKDPALVGLMADDGRQHGGGDVVDGAHAQPCHHQVEEHVHARAHFRHAIEVAGKVGGGRGADADDRARQPCLADRFSAADGSPALLFGHIGDRLQAAAAVGLAGMRHDAAQAACGMQHTGDGEKMLVITRLHAGAVAVAIDLDQRGHGAALGRGTIGDRLGGFDAVDDHGQVHALAAQGEHAVQLGRRHADGIQQIGDAGRGELFGFLQRGHGGRALGARHHAAGHVDRFRRFKMRPQLHPMAGHQRVQALDIARHASFIQQQARRVQGIQGGR
ncbi:hypothetical protein G6F22_010905 [Rhizopus arrhizus]|nr:hypothetical protein G6F22_010905 [Rhizopus arrhizus]